MQNEREVTREISMPVCLESEEGEGKEGGTYTSRLAVELNRQRRTEPNARDDLALDELKALCSLSGDGSGLDDGEEGEEGREEGEEHGLGLWTRERS